MFNLSNWHKPTSAKMAKLGTSLVAVSAFIAGYGFTEQVPYLGYIGLGIGVVGCFLSNIYGNEKV